MNITVIKEENVCTLLIEGRIDTVTSAELNSTFQENAAGCDKMIFDMSGVDYISSAGLRVLLYAQKVMNKQGSMVIKNAGPEIREIFDVTGFVDILTIE